MKICFGRFFSYAVSAMLIAFAGATSAAAERTRDQVVDGVAIYFGIVPAPLVRGHSRQHPEGAMHGDPCAGENHIAFAQVTPTLAPTREYSEKTAREIDRAVRALVSAAFDKASGILTRQRELLERGAQQLLQKETLSEEDLVKLRPQTPAEAKQA